MKRLLTLAAMTLVICSLTAATAVAAPGSSVVDLAAGSSSGITLNDQGHPVVAFHGKSGSTLELATCSTVTCEGDVTVTTVDGDPDDSAGDHPDITLDANGNPAIAYFAFGDQDVRYVRCDDPQCANETPTTITSNGVPTSEVGVALGENGRTFILFNRNIPTLGLWLAVCEAADPQCESPTVTEIEGDAAYALDFSMVLDKSGYPVIGYRKAHPLNDDDDHLRIVHCDDFECLGESPTEIATKVASVAVDIDSFGRPVVAYNRMADGYSYLLRCNDANCNGYAGPNFLNAAFVGGRQGIDMRLASWNRPVVTISEATGGDRTAVIACNDATCASYNNQYIDADLHTGYFPRLVLDDEGHPIVSYTNAQFNQLRIAHCAKCVPTAHPWHPNFPIRER